MKVRSLKSTIESFPQKGEDCGSKQRLQRGREGAGSKGAAEAEEDQDSGTLKAEESSRRGPIRGKSIEGRERGSGGVGGGGGAVRRLCR